nr:hypothetical protein [Tanacetum cinerariifolium]
MLGVNAWRTLLTKVKLAGVSLQIYSLLLRISVLMMLQQKADVKTMKFNRFEKRWHVERHLWIAREEGCKNCSRR